MAKRGAATESVPGAADTSTPATPDEGITVTMNVALRAAAVTTAVVLGVTGAAAAPASAGGTAFPTTIALPDGFRPEGIAIGPGPFAYFGSLADGSIYRANLVTGTGSIISPGGGSPSVGMKTDGRGRLFIAGGPAGTGRVVDTRTGTVLASYQFATPPGTFVNDVVLTPRAAYFTDSNRAALYRVPLGRRGQLPPADGFTTLPLTGAIVVDPAAFNANGIARTPDGRGLIIVQSNTGLLFRVDPGSGATTGIDVGGFTFTNGDGLLLLGRTLYVVQNRLNVVTVVALNRSGTCGEVVRQITDPRFDVPTTVAAFGNRLYLPNARFTTPPTPTTTYTAVAVRR